MTTSDTPVTIRLLQAADLPAVWPILRTTFQAGDTYDFAPDSTEAEIHKAWVELPAATFVALGAGGENSRPQRFHAGIDEYVIAMDAYAFEQGEAA